MNKLLALLFLFINTSLLSQNNEGEIEDAQIIIQKNSKIILNNVDKNIEKIQLESNPFKKKSIEFNDFEYKIINTAIGQISEPVLLPEGIVFFKVRDKRVSKKNIDLVQARQQIINSEKTKILNMYSLSHYDTLRRTIEINYY